jgi:uncharacterized membrane protein HdeD (DUF308 family)
MPFASTRVSLATCGVWPKGCRVATNPPIRLADNNEREIVSEVEFDVYDTKEEARKSWWLLLLLGIISLGVGGLLIFWPSSTITVVTMIVGFFMIVTGVVRFFVAVFDSHSQDRWLMVFAGIVGIVLGVVVMKNPEGTIKVIALIVAIFWLVAGLVDFFRGLTNSDLPDRSARIVFGLMSVIFGVIILVWPAITVGVFAILVGIYAVFFGILEIIAAFQIKNS